MNNNKINKILSSVDIVNIISEIITLNKKGNNFIGLCPFHSDNSPSLVASREKQIYKCFVCNHGGNVFNFIRAYYNLSFIDSVRKVIQLANLNIEIEKTTEEIQKSKLLENKSIKINELSNYFFQHNLLNTDNDFKKYLINQRKLNIKTINKYQLGATSENGKLKQFLISHNFSDSDILKSQLIFIDDDRSRFQDFFTKRIIFPINNEFNLTVGFSGRTISTQVKAKYINSKESEIFKKHELLYNFYHAKQSPIIALKKFVFIVEGFMDVIALDLVGFDNVVAIMGLNLSKIQMQKLKSLSSNIVLFLDNDQAGNNTNLKFIDSLVQNGFKIKVVNNNAKKDPFDIWQFEGREKLLTILDARLDWWEFKYLFFKKQNSTELISDILNIYQSIDNKVYRLNFLNYIKNDDLNIYQQTLSILNDGQENQQKVDYNWELLKKMITSKYFTTKYSNEIFYIPNIKMNNIASYIVKYYNRYDYLTIVDITSFFENEIINLDLRTLAFDLLKAVNDHFENLINHIFSNIKSSVISDLKTTILNETNPTIKQEKILNLTKIIKFNKKTNSN